MEVGLLEKKNDNHINYESYKRKYTVNTIDSSPEFQNKTYLSKIIVSISFMSLIIGIYILFYKSYYLNPNYNFSNPKLLYYYILIYTLGLFGVIVIAFLFALLIKLISSIRNCFKSKKGEIEKEKENILIDENDEDDNFLTEILQNADRISMIPYTYSICILLTILLYLFGFPFSWFLIYTLISNNIYYQFYQFFLLYFFIFINNISGAIFLFISIIFIHVRRQNSLRKLSFNYDEDNLMAVYKEVKDAMDLGK